MNEKDEMKNWKKLALPLILCIVLATTILMFVPVKIRVFAYKGQTTAPDSFEHWINITKSSELYLLVSDLEINFTLDETDCYILIGEAEITSTSTKHGNTTEIYVNGYAKKVIVQGDGFYLSLGRIEIEVSLVIEELTVNYNMAGYTTAPIYQLIWNVVTNL